MTKDQGKKRTGCLSCGGVGSYVDTTYNRTGDHVECMRCFGTGKSEAEIRAIVRAAPDLLAACQAFIDHFDSGRRKRANQDAARDMIRAAIRKAQP